MIIAATRIRAASGPQKLADHVWRGEGNDEIVTQQGSETDLEDMVATARHTAHRYAIRHYHISPGEPVTDAEALVILTALATEFKFDPEATVLVRHHKPRHGGHDLMLGTQGYEQHWHVLVPEVDPVTLRSLDCRWMRPRHERLAREAEVRLLHKIVKGRWNSSVIAELERRNAPHIARLLVEAGIDEVDPAYAAYTGPQRRRLERLHAGPDGGTLHVPAMVRELQRLWAAHANVPARLDQELRRHGLRLRHPDAPPASHNDNGTPIAPAPVTRAEGWVVDAWDGRSRQAYVLGALHRLVQEPRQRVDATLRPRMNRVVERTANGTGPAAPQPAPIQTGPSAPAAGEFHPTIIPDTADNTTTETIKPNSHPTYVGSISITA